MTKKWFLMLASCMFAAGAAGGEWEVESWSDEITDDSYVVASRLGDDPANELRVSCLADTMSVSFHLPGMQAYEGLYSADYRFDDRPGVVDMKWLNVRGPAHVLGTFEFLDALEASNRLILRLRAANGDVTSARFDVSDFSGALAKLQEACPSVEESILAAQHRATVAACSILAMRESNDASMVPCVLTEERARQWLAANAQASDEAERCVQALHAPLPFMAAKTCVEQNRQ